MQKYFFQTIGLGVLLSVVAVAAPPQRNENAGTDGQSERRSSEQSANVDDFFKKYDKNNDGSITQDELGTDMHSGFKRMDRDSNGQLSRQEIRSHARRMQQGGRPAEATFVWVIAAERDAPSLQELQDAYDLLRKVDADNNDQITKQEIASAREELMEKHCQAAFKDADTDHNGEISKDEAKNTPLERKFSRIDSDGDGSVTQQELKDSVSGEQTAAASRTGADTSRK